MLIRTDFQICILYFFFCLPFLFSFNILLFVSFCSYKNVICLLFPHKNNRPAYVIYIGFRFIRVVGFDQMSLFADSLHTIIQTDTENCMNREEKNINWKKKANRETNINETAQIETMCWMLKWNQYKCIGSVVYY